MIMEEDNCPQATEKGHNILIHDKDVSGLWKG